ncbi:diguanylate cyclase [Pacificimonas sp. WHA3]|uniref:diguanylate cyclase n=1 Tax=Pacificimonas pallii TaxID=2827236 RepID=A0ABS6SBG9_9SPHN|nr:GGDEF domain-containing protein [Pacificimonas pallii]MBV7255762.1 diguanylate cyclase [Pacificimonas pallii]
MPASLVSREESHSDSPVDLQRPPGSVTGGAHKLDALAKAASDLSLSTEKTFTAMRAEVRSLEHQLNAARIRIAELERQTETDDLVPIANRRGFTRDVTRAIADLERHGTSSAVIFIDVDHMKTINDEHGHLAGDAALLHVGSVLLENLRTTDSLARIGGDEFVVLLSHVDETDARRKATELSSAVADMPVQYAGWRFPLTISVGVQMLKPGVGFDRLLSDADQEMYAVKRQNRT